MNIEQILPVPQIGNYSSAQPDPGGPDVTSVAASPEAGDAGTGSGSPGGSSAGADSGARHAAEAHFRASKGDARPGSVIRALIADTDGEPGSSVRLDVTVDPKILTEAVAREMAQKVPRTLEENMLLEKSRAMGFFDKPTPEPPESRAEVKGTGPDENAYGVILSDRN